MQVEAIGTFPSQAGQAGIHSGNIDRDTGIVNWTWIEKGRHQGELVMLAAKIEFLPALPGVPKRAHGCDLLFQLADYRFGPGHTKAPFDVRFDLSAQTEDKASF